MPVISLPTSDGALEPFETSPPRDFESRRNGAFNRVALAAAHVVADPLADVDPWLEPAIDWERTLAYRHYLWQLGLGVAEAMDTAQRGMGLDWTGALELVRRSVAAARDVPGAVIACGAGTDHLAPDPNLTLDRVIAAYEEQVSAVEAAGGRIILMASRALAACAKGPDDYARVYGRILEQVREPVIIHWLGEMFDPALEGYWGSGDHWQAMETCLEILEAHSAKIDGVKISL
ncbi:MAG: dihydrodipicolinate synthase family protein, partial [Kiloniellales bacterium]|nr:dihydrodipicolinate synthase family protein [Kiloniellales bacterium]